MFLPVIETPSSSNRICSPENRALPGGNENFHHVQLPTVPAGLFFGEKRARLAKVLMYIDMK